MALSRFAQFAPNCYDDSHYGYRGNNYYSDLPQPVYPSSCNWPPPEQMFPQPKKRLVGYILEVKQKNPHVQNSDYIIPLSVPSSHLVEALSVVHSSRFDEIPL